MKGSVDTSTLMRAVLQESSGLRTGRLLSDVFIFEFPKRTDNKLIMITDGGLNLSLDLKGKVDLIKNAVRVACRAVMSSRQNPGSTGSAT